MNSAQENPASGPRERVSAEDLFIGLQFAIPILPRQASTCAFLELAGSGRWTDCDGQQILDQDEDEENE